MKVIIAILITIYFMSCDSKPFINSTLKAEKIGVCTDTISPATIDRNMNGETYEFEYCLNDGFDEKDYTVTREGDTLLLKLPVPTVNTNMSLYKLKLDIDASPQYKYIKLGDQLMDIGISVN